MSPWGRGAGTTGRGRAGWTLGFAVVFAALSAGAYLLIDVLAGVRSPLPIWIMATVVAFLGGLVIARDRHHHD